MLSTEALDSAIPLADRFDQKGFLVLPRQETPLALLVGHTRAGDEVVATPDGVHVRVDIEQMSLSAAQKPPGYEESTHDEILDEVASVCIPAVQGHIKHAKEIVAPCVDDLVTRVTETLAGMTPSELLGMEVIVDTLPAPLTNASFDSLIRKYEETPLNSPKMDFNLPDQSGQEIIELMKTGSSSLDGDIETFAHIKGDGFLMQVWRDLFQQTQTEVGESYRPRFIDHLQKTDDGLDIAVTVFLLANKLFENPIEGVTMSLSQYETLMADYRDQAAALLSRELNAFDDAERNGAMVVSFTKNKIIVNANLYRKWIEEGGDNNVLFGNLLQSNPYVMLEDIETNAQKLKRAWANHSALISTVESNRRFMRIKEALGSAFRKQLRDTSDEELASINYDNVVNKFDELLDAVTEDELDPDCIYTLCLKLVCRSRFARSEAERILGGIDLVKEKNPSLDIREAATISIASYVAWWVASQMQVVDAKSKQAQED